MQTLDLIPNSFMAKSHRWKLCIILILNYSPKFIIRLVSLRSIGIILIIRISAGNRTHSLISYFIAFEITLYALIFSLSWFHLIILLIILELLSLKVFLVRIVTLNIGSNPTFIFTLVTLRVAEARVGLRALTMLIRSHGEDLLFLQNL